MTLKQNTEYTVKLGINSYQGGGPRGGIHGGGGLAVIYEKARVIAVCGRWWWCWNWWKRWRWWWM